MGNISCCIIGFKCDSLFLLHFRHGEFYTWQNINCCVHNVIVGKLWVEHVSINLFLTSRHGHLYYWDKSISTFRVFFFGVEIAVSKYCVDYDQRPHSAVFGLGLHCLDMSPEGVSCLKRVNFIVYYSREISLT